MSDHEVRRGFPWGKLILAVIVVGVLRVNLPPNNVSSALDLTELEKENWFTKAAAGTAAKILMPDSVAAWEYTDLLILRLARSSRIKAVAVDLPFCGWRVYNEGE
jgi:hypothetical protein